MSGTGSCWDSGTFYTENCKLARAVFAEFIGTAIFVLMGLASCLNWTHDTDHDQLIRIGITFGFALIAIIYMFGKISGGHVNPALTISFMIAGRIKIVPGLLYIVAQLIGSIVGAGILYSLQAEDYSGHKSHFFGVTKVNPDLAIHQGLFTEMIISMILILGVLFLTDDNWNEYSAVAPIGIGVLLATLEFGFVNATGGSMNPARSTGPACIVGDVDELWIYWVGPILGGVIAVMIYLLFTYTPQSAPQMDPSIDWGTGDVDVSIPNTGSSTMSYGGSGMPMVQTPSNQFNANFPSTLQNPGSPTFRGTIPASQVPLYVNQ